MNKNVQIEVFTGADGSSAFLVLPDNSSLTIKRSSNLFGRGDIFSYNFRVSAAANRHVMKNAATAHGELLRDILQDAPANIYIYGAIYSSGFLKVGDKDFDEDGDIDLSFYGGRKSFDKMIANKNANDIPLLSQIQLGWAHDRTCSVTGAIGFPLEVLEISGSHIFKKKTIAVDFSGLETVRMPKFVVVKGDLAAYEDNVQPDEVEHYDFTNTYHAYDDANPEKYPYCNIPVAYTRYVRVKKSNNKEYEDEKKREYHISDAGRINSAPNFFVMYWLRALFKSLGITIAENQMAEVEDLSRLFFVNTSLHYDEDVKTPRKLWRAYREDEFSAEDGKRTFNALLGAGMWCTSYIEKDNCKREALYTEQFAKYGFRVVDVYGDKIPIVNSAIDRNDNFYPAYATPKNFPKESVASILESLEKAFGIRFIFSDDMTSVRIVLVSKILRKNQSNKISVNITGVSYKQPEIKGLRWKYGSGSGVQYNYPPFDRILYPRAKPEDTGYTIYDRWDFTKGFGEIVDEISDTNATCYVDPWTGNAYRIAVNENTLVDGTLIEVGAFEAAVEGDVDVDDDYIQEETIGFTPLQMNRIDGQYALYVGDEMQSSFYDPDRPVGDNFYTNKTQGYGQMRLVGNVTLKGAARMRWEDVDYTIPDAVRAVLSFGWAACYPDNFNYDGIKDSPIENAVDGFSLCLLRGPAGGVAGATELPSQPQDDANVVGWELSAGTGVNIHPDTCDESGVLFDYNGNYSGYSQEIPGPYADRASRAVDACGELGIDTSWAPKLAAAIPRKMRGFPPDSNDGQPESIRTRYDGNPSIMYCTADAYVEYGGAIHRLLFTPLWEPESLSYDIYKGYCNIIRGFFAQAESAAAEGSDFEQILQAALALMAAEPGYAKIVDNILPIYNVTQTVIQEFAAQWHYVMYGSTDTPAYYGGRFSLKLRAEKPNPFYDPASEDPEKRERYLPIRHVRYNDIRRRGLVDTLLSQYKEYLLHGRTATFDGVMSYQDFLNIDEFSYNEIGGCTGIIKSIQATVGGEEVKVKIELLYL